MGLKFYKANFFLILVVLLAAILRFLYLDRIPTGIGGDEMTYLITAKALALTGSDVTGTWNPLSIIFFRYPLGETQAELLYFLYAPIVGFFNFSLFSARFINAILGTLSVIPLYFIAKKLINKQVGVFAAFIFAINPWQIYISRTAYELTPAVFFFLTGLSLVFSKRSRIYYSIPAFFLAFYSYIGTKLIFFPIAAIAIFYGYFFYNKKQFKKQYLTVLAACLFLVLFFLISLKLSPQSSRMGELLSPNSPLVVNQVNTARKNSIQTPLTNIFENKLSVTKQIMATKLFKSISSEYLFVYGDNFFSIYRHGIFYYADALFLFLGVLFIFARKRAVFVFLTFLGLIGILPQLLHGNNTDNFTPHIIMLFPFLIIFIAAGLGETTQFIKKRWYFLASIMAIFLIYFFSVLNFFNIYFFQHSLKGYFDFPIRIISRYAVLTDNKEQITVFSTRSSDLFKKYLFYTNNYNRQTAALVKELVLKKEYKLNNILFASCDRSIDFGKFKGVAIYDVECGQLIKEAKNYLTISRLSDGGRVFRIYNDKTCRDAKLNAYPQNITLDSLVVENLSKKSFCEAYINPM